MVVLVRPFEAVIFSGARLHAQPHPVTRPLHLEVLAGKDVLEEELEIAKEVANRTAAVSNATLS